MARAAREMAGDLCRVVHAPTLDDYIADLRAAVEAVGNEASTSASLKATY